MMKLATLAAAAMLYISIVPQAFAQAANPEPGYCAQFYPNADCNSIGPETPASRDSEKTTEPEPEPTATPPKPATAAKKKKPHPAAASAKQP